MRDFLAITKALGDEPRVRALMALRRGELCLCQIIDLLGLAPSTVSKHMTLLQQAGLIARRKEGKWHYYRLAEDSPSPRVRATLDWIADCLDREPAVRGDRKRVDEVKRISLEQLCGCYRT
jgi:ArsR family transcriptional regulator